MTDKDKQWLSERHNVKPEEITWYHSGICYSRIKVTSKDAADKVTASVKGKYVNGGMFHGMELGNQTEYKQDGTWEVMV